MEIQMDQLQTWFCMVAYLIDSQAVKKVVSLAFWLVKTWNVKLALYTWMGTMLVEAKV